MVYVQGFAEGYGKEELILKVPEKIGGRIGEVPQ